MQKNNFKKRGQIQVSDLLISLSIFLLLLAVAYVTWYKEVDITAEKLVDFRANQAAERALRSIADSPGFPSNWASLEMLPSSPSLLGIGAADSYASIDGQKLILMGTYYNSSAYHNFTRQKMGISPFEADLRISYLNGTNISVMGNAPARSDIVLASGQKLANFGNETVLVRVRVWQAG